MNAPKETLHAEETNADPITGTPGAHPIGVGLGAAGVGAAGTIAGAIAGPVGAVVGAAIGAVAGGLAGKSVAETFDPTVEEAYWREHHASQPYAHAGTYDDFAPAYRTGYEGYGHHRRRDAGFEEAETQLHQYYDNFTEASGNGSAALARAGRQNLSWQDARPAAKAAWNRMEATGRRAGV